MRTERTIGDDRVLAPARWTAAAVVPVLVSAFAILYLFPGSTKRLWGWMVCPDMNALVMGGGYLSGAYFFWRVTREREWHRVSAGFVATTAFSSILMVTTVMHWNVFNHDHVSFWAWLALYVSTPLLLPILWFKNQRHDPRTPSEVDATIPRALAVAAGTGGAVQLGFAAYLFGWPESAARYWPWVLEPATARSLSAFIAFPAMTWVWFLVDRRWSSFRITQQTATLGMLLLGLGALRAHADFHSGRWFAAYLGALAVAIGLSVTLQLTMERRSRDRTNWHPKSGGYHVDSGARTGDVGQLLP